MHRRHDNEVLISPSTQTVSALKSSLYPSLVSAHSDVGLQLHDLHVPSFHLTECLSLLSSVDEDLRGREGRTTALVISMGWVESVCLSYPKVIA